MILILASKPDLPARRLVEMWSAHSARLVTPADLSRNGWCMHVGDHASERGADFVVANGERIATDSVTGVLARIAAVTPGDLTHIAEEDREYVASEMNAFLVAWLSRLDCPVINPPSSISPMGASYGVEGWMMLAVRAGLRPSWTRREYPRPVAEEPWSSEHGHVTVLGDRTFGAVDPALAEQARRRAAEARTELLAVVFSHAGADATFVAAHLWPDVSVPEVAAALLPRLGGVAGKAPSILPRPAGPVT